MTTELDNHRALRNAIASRLRELEAGLIRAKPEYAKAICEEIDAHKKLLSRANRLVARGTTG